MTATPPNKIQNGAGEQIDPDLDVDLDTLDTAIIAEPISGDDEPAAELAGPITYLEPTPPPAAPAWLTAPAPDGDEPHHPPPPKIDSRREVVVEPDDELDEGEPLPGLDPRAVGIAAAVIVMLALAYATAGIIAAAFPPLASWAGLAVLTAYTAAVSTLGLRMWHGRPVLTAWPGMAAVLTVCVGASLLVAATAVHAVVALIS